MEKKMGEKTYLKALDRIEAIMAVLSDALLAEFNASGSDYAKYLGTDLADELEDLRERTEEYLNR